MSSPATKYDGWSRDRLIAELEKVSNQFGLRWDARQADRNFDEEQKSSLVVLNHSPELSVGNGPYQNMLIEGDNFDALRYLSVTHRGKVKCIYIDPPYNTGNKDFIYKDNFLDKDAPFRHSRWLAFMHARLRIAKDILAHDGVIFASIDENEYAHLKMLMDQVFAGQYIGTFVKRVAGGKNDSKFIKEAHEYLLVYGDVAGLRLKESAHEKDSIRNLRKDGDTDRQEDRPNLHYPLYASVAEGKVALAPFNGSEEVLPVRPDGTPGRWRWSRETAQNDIARLVPQQMRNGRTGVYVLSEAGVSKVSPWVSLIDDQDDADSCWHSIIEDHAKGGGAHLASILGDKAFTYPKNPDFIEWVCSLVADKNAVFMDFFAGSGTTAEAVLRLNKADGGQRRFICVSATEATEAAPLKNICRDVAASRITKVIKGYSFTKEGKPKSVTGLGGAFAYLQANALPVSDLGFELRDEQIWHALQLLQLSSIVPYDPEQAAQVVTASDGAIAYCVAASSPEVQARLAAVSKVGPVRVFTRKITASAEAWATACGNVELLPIPQDLLDIFGVTE